MVIKQIFSVLGVRSFNDVIEGQKHDFTKINVVMDMPEKDNALGMDCTALSFGTSENFARFKGLKFPCQLELELNPTTKGFAVTNFAVVK